jgi:hypothetical protein
MLHVGSAFFLFFFFSKFTMGIWSFSDLKVAQAVEMMKSMGFADEGGCLTRLLTATDGNIAKALDTLKLGAEQASRLA